MAVKITISDPPSIKWPARCSKSMTKDDLVWASATSGHVNSVRPTLTGTVNVDSTLVNIHFPVNSQHAKGLGLANLLTRSTLGFKIIRGFAYFFGALATPMLLIKLVSLFIGNFTSSSDMPVAFFLMYLAGFILMLMIIWAYRKQPVRVIKSKEDAVTLKFQNEEYAKQFYAANQANIIQQ